MAGVDRTKMHNLKVENDVVFEEVLKTIAWETLSQMALRNCSKEVVEETGYIGIFVENKTKENKMWSNIKRLLLITKNQTLKLMIIVLFYIWADARVWAH